MCSIEYNEDELTDKLIFLAYKSGNYNIVKYVVNNIDDLKYKEFLITCKSGSERLINLYLLFTIRFRKKILMMTMFILKYHLLMYAQVKMKVQ